MTAIGDTLGGNYVVVRRLGAGGFGEVFLADDNVIPDRQVAIKVLRRGSAGDDDLIWEMRTLAASNHPGIVSFYHHFLDAERLYLVMEYCAGGSLHDRLAGFRAAPVDEAFRWGVALCETLGFVHGKEIVHHDVKPGNILFTRDGALKLGDFGIANRNLGTLIYLPPEMLLGERVSRTDPRVDVYALGLTLLEAVTGHHPFEDVARDEAVRARVAHDFVPDSLPRWVQEVLLKATHPTPELRFQTMQDFAEAIQGRAVPYVFDGERIKAHALAEKAEAKIARRKWKSAETLATQALQLSPDCVAALLAAGRCQLLMRRTASAKEHFSQAVAISPRTQVQKELGWLNVEEGRLPIAISLLTDHLQRNSADYEAYNLLLKCYVLSDRFEAGEDLAEAVIAQKPPNDCFAGNLLLCQLLLGRFTQDQLRKLRRADEANPFLAHNLAVASETPRAWTKDGTPTLKSKLLFQEYRHGAPLRHARANVLAISLPNGMRREISTPVVTIGSLLANEVALNENTVSRRHCAVVNVREDVWLHDLGSTAGTSVDGRKVSGRLFLDGVHDVDVGRLRLRIAASASLLV